MLNRQFASYASLPSWAYSQLSPEDVDAELRERRLLEAARQFEELSADEEADYQAARQRKLA